MLLPRTFWKELTGTSEATGHSLKETADAKIPTNYGFSLYHCPKDSELVLGMTGPFSSVGLF